MAHHLKDGGGHTQGGAGGGGEQDVGHVGDGGVGDDFFHVLLGDRTKRPIERTDCR